jgi:cyclic-di-AMP phosphodiesterase PgpH
MSSGPIRTRSDRVANLHIDSFSWSALWPVLRRFIYALVAIILVAMCVKAWNPPFPYRLGYIPARAIVARVPFEILDVKQTEKRKEQAGREVLCFYKNNPQLIGQLRNGVRDYILRLARSTDFETLDDQQQVALESLVPSSINGQVITTREAYNAIHDLLTTDGKVEQVTIDKLDNALRIAFDPIEETGLLENLKHTIDEGNQRAIRVINSNDESEPIEVDVRRVRIIEVIPVLRESLDREFKIQFEGSPSSLLAGMIMHYVQPKLADTLTWEQKQTSEARLRREAEVKPTMIQYTPSVTTLVAGGRPLTQTEIDLLRAEYNAWITQQGASESVLRFGAYFGMLAAICLLCGLFIFFQVDRTILVDDPKLLRLLGLSSACILLSVFAAQDPYRARVLPLVLTAMIATIVFGRSAALMLLTALSLAITLSLGMDLAEFVISFSVSATAILLLGRVRTRERPVQVAAIAAIVVAATTMGVGTMIGKANGISQEIEQLPVVGGTVATTTPMIEEKPPTLMQQLFWEAVRHAGYTLLAGIILVGTLGLVEIVFNVQTDISLIILAGDANHALLRQLAQRAPGTYNHSITVASIAEAAADSIIKE